jgi:hypothetical protein
VEFTVTESGEVLLGGLAIIPADQRGFWTEDWQAGEREASEQIAAGNLAVHDDVDALFRRPRPLTASRPIGWRRSGCSSCRSC